MTLWDLPGPKQFIESARDVLNRGSNLVVRFPGSVPDGFDDAMMAALDNALHFVELMVTDSPLKDLARNFARDPNAVRSLSQLLAEERFRGLLIRLEDIDERTWPAWRDFLEHYADVLRGIPLLGRALFCVPLAGSPPGEPPRSDVTLINREWDGVVDEIDLLLFASERLRSRVSSSLARRLLATSVSRVARWDFDTAANLLEEGDPAILAPLEILRSIARDKGWTSETPLDWKLGTVSKAGVTHPARAAVETPPREIDRRMWSAQVAVLMPRIEELRYCTVQNNLADIEYRMRRGGMNHGDPHDLELGELTKLFEHSGGHRRLRNFLFWLRDLRNSLAHLSPLPPDVALKLLQTDEQHSRVTFV